MLTHIQQLADADPIRIRFRIPDGKPHLIGPELIHHVGQLKDAARRVHGHQHVSPVPQGGEDVSHQLFVALAALGLDVGGVVGVRDEKAGPRQAVYVASVQMSLLHTADTIINTKYISKTKTYYAKVTSRRPYFNSKSNKTTKQ